jgi:hypothetical protein
MWHDGRVSNCGARGVMTACLGSRTLAIILHHVVTRYYAARARAELASVDLACSCRMLNAPCVRRQNVID